MLFMWFVYGTLSYRRERRVRRCVTLMRGTTLKTLEFRTPLMAIRITQSGRRTAASTVLSVQAPAAQATSLIHGVTYHEADDELTYYIPESGSLGMPLGFRIKRSVQFLFGLPPKYTATVLLTPVIVEHTGVWFPALVNSETGLMALRHLLPGRIAKEYWTHGHRDRFICDFVAKGDPTGSIQIGGRHGKRIPVYAPCDGFIMAYEVEKYAPVVPNANVMFLGQLQGLKHVTFEGERAGTFSYSPKSGSPVGRIVEAGTVLCEVMSMGFSQEVAMPETGLILRQFVQPGDVVDYTRNLFLYLPLEPLA